MPTSLSAVGLAVPGPTNVTAGSDYETFSVTVAGGAAQYVTLTLDRAIQIDHPYYPGAGFGGQTEGGPTTTSTILVYYGDSPPPLSKGFPTTYDSRSHVTNADGSITYSVRTPLAAGTKAGTYNVVEVDLTDGANTTSVTSGADLAAHGQRTGFAVTADQVGPTITALTLPTGAIVASQNGLTALSVAASDVGSGVQSVVVHIAGAGLNDIAFSSLPRGMAATLGTTQLTGGAGSAGIATAGLHGSYNVSAIDVTDVAGNVTNYSATQLQGLGFATQFMVGRALTADFNGDAHSDLLWLHQSGAVSTWSAIGSGGRNTIAQDTYDAVVDRQWRAVDTFDWNGDGKADIIWRYPNGNLSIWNGTATGFVQGAYNDATVPPDWKIAGAGDLNGDGYGDLLWRNDNGAVSTWLSQGSGTFAKNVFYQNSPGGDWKIEGLGDFTGDARADILWRNDNGGVSVWRSTGSAFDVIYNRAPVDRSWHIEGIGDFNGDGRDDIVWVNDNGSVSAWLGTANGFIENRFNTAVPGGWRVAEVGDFNADGLADLLWRNTNGNISTWNSTGDNWSQNTYYDASVGNDWTLIGHDFPL